MGQSQTIQITPDTLTYQAYGSKTNVERFQCSYGLNEDYRNHLIKGGIRIAGTDADQNVKIVELTHHPFFIDTLFLPQLTSTPQLPHPLVKAYLKAIATYRTLKLN